MWFKIENVIVGIAGVVVDFICRMIQFCVIDLLVCWFVLKLFPEQRFWQMYFYILSGQVVIYALIYNFGLFKKIWDNK